jgi:hypothetical protein
MVLPLPIGIAPVAHPSHEDELNVVADGVDDAVVATHLRAIEDRLPTPL